MMPTVLKRTIVWERHWQNTTGQNTAVQMNPWDSIFHVKSRNIPPKQHWTSRPASRNGYSRPVFQIRHYQHTNQQQKSNLAKYGVRIRS